jgi:hypothetical protein
MKAPVRILCLCLLFIRMATGQANVLLQTAPSSLFLSWDPQEGTTITVQASDNLVDWKTQPVVFSGAEPTPALSFPVFPENERWFFRLRSSASGDTNENGLPDHWEWTHFGELDIDPLADPDRDGLSNHEEFTTGTDPADYYNGQMPRIVLLGPDKWNLTLDTPSTQQVAFVVTSATGLPLANAPVSISCLSGDPVLQVDGDPIGVPALALRTDALGRIQPPAHSIRAAIGPGIPTHQILLINAGSSQQSIALSSLESSIPLPPREVLWEPISQDAALISWRGPPHHAATLRIERQAATGAWLLDAELMVDHLPAPDPLTGRYDYALDP